MIGRMSVLATVALTALAMPVAAQPSRDAELHAFLQERFAEDRTSFPDTRYAHGWADLNGDGRPEAFVYLMSGNYCGSGGCDLFVYRPEQGSFYQVTRTSVTQPPVRVLNSRNEGWRDIAVGVSGGGARARTVILQFRGYGYPGNPTTDGTTARGTPAGRVVIAATDRGRPLF